MHRLGLTIEKVKGIFISHEHSDHIKGLPVLSKKYQLPVYITPATLQYTRMQIQANLLRSFKAYEPIQLGRLRISPFPKKHDAIEPHSFTIGDGSTTVGVFTDIGSHCEHLIHHFKQCHAVFLEANYDDDLLDKGRYPFFLKNRIRGGNGHLSNQKALELFLDYRTPQLSHLFLSHLSKDNNCADLVQRLFETHAGATHVIVASRDRETAIYQING